MSWLDLEADFLRDEDQRFEHETLKDEENLKHQKEGWKLLQRGQWGEVQVPLAAR